MTFHVHAQRPVSAALACLAIMSTAAAVEVVPNGLGPGPSAIPEEVVSSVTPMELIPLRLARADGRVRDVLGLLARPRAKGEVPAVILVPDGLGLDQRLSAVAERLEAEGWATLQIDLDPVSTDGHTPQGFSPLGLEADANAVVGDLALVLQVLSEDPGINPNRIAVVGLGTGGRAALLAGSEAAMSLELDTFGARFAAHAAFYSGCAALLAEGFAAPVPWSNAPVAAFHAGQDRQNTAAACDTLGNTLAVRRRPPAVWHAYPIATHAWDFGAATGNTAMLLANLGTTRVPVAPDHHVAEDATGRLISFLRPVLGKPPQPR